MGILNPIKKQFIKRPDTSKSQIVYKWPDNTIRMHTLLTVEPDEVALFIKEGALIGVLNEGIHTLDGANIPFIGGLINLGTGGNYFASELYFVSIREFPDILFGGPIDNIADSSSTLILSLKCFGSFSLKIVKPQNLILNLVGTSNLNSTESIEDWTKEQFLKIVREVITGHIISSDISQKWDILGISSKNESIEQESISKVNTILDNYGIRLSRMGNLTVSIDEKDMETLKQLKRDYAYSNNQGAADVALKLGAAKGFENSEGQNISLLGAGIGLGNAAAQGAILNTNQTGFIICPNCKAKNMQNSKFCNSCGESL